MYRKSRRYSPNKHSRKNKTKFTQREVRAAEEERRVYGVIRRPSLWDFFKIIVNKALLGCGITVRNVKVA